ncbi:sirohydrochlorin chelatase [Aestuariimicrobium sp. T2.26MG-19.2B]|uniref:sirohydrochlorin chelatase n=1 Tax=Aestuariimicrobium sp. T2.26MG-19.2B TaxID=3040679 RepID=UPI00247772F9|nr:CbiX/SirB N-terminal domain-containing protein [Aestuariimicrobium sp. T2.26MG-19.2B]CAI9408831.1 hypothetical protein AESSP_02106 [Aestuariimicrobium sp. T2.26MG-19.2B]
MTAPALVLAAVGGDDAHVRQVVHTLATRMMKLRPTVSVQTAMVDGSGYQLRAAVERLSQQGADEIVVVPLDVTSAIDAHPDLAGELGDLTATYPLLRIAMARPIGPAAELLNILDDRLRTALRATRTVELDALVLSLPAGGDVRGHGLVSRRARQWATHHKLPCVVAVADGSGPNVAQAIATLRGQGRRHIAVGSLFLAEGPRWTAQAELALHSGAVAVSGPLGADERVLDLVMARYAYAAMDLLEADSDAPLTDVELHTEDALIELLAHS